MLVKGHELPDKLAAVVQYQAHAVVNVLLHLTSLGRLARINLSEMEAERKREART